METLNQTNINDVQIWYSASGNIHNIHGTMYFNWLQSVYALVNDITIFCSYGCRYKRPTTLLASGDLARFVRDMCEICARSCETFVRFVNTNHYKKAV